jgi:hypothetical protein
MHSKAYIFMFTFVSLLGLSFVIKENIHTVNLFKQLNIEYLITTSLFNCLMYSSLAYIYMVEGYLKKITYIYKKSENEEEIQNKKELKYKLYFGYFMMIIILYIILKKILNKNQKKN